MTDITRRPLKTRDTAWATGLAKAVAGKGLKPDLISGAGVAVSVLGAALLCVSGAVESGPRGVVLVLVAACIQLRLLANMLDGMVATEHGRGSPYGPIWNELPDRFADVFFLAAAGYAALAADVPAGPALGWICAVLAVVTAYIRQLGQGLGVAADYAGPMAKPHRMAALTIACLVSAVEPLWGWRGQTLLIALAVIALGSVVTVWRRTRHLARALSVRAADGPAPGA